MPWANELRVIDAMLGLLPASSAVLVTSIASKQSPSMIL